MLALGSHFKIKRKRLFNIKMAKRVLLKTLRKFRYLRNRYSKIKRKYWRKPFIHNHTRATKFASSIYSKITKNQYTPQIIYEKDPKNIIHPFLIDTLTIYTDSFN